MEKVGGFSKRLWSVKGSSAWAANGVYRVNILWITKISM